MLSYRATSVETTADRPASVLSNSASLSGPCSACASRSAAQASGSARVVGDDHDLARAGREVDSDLARDEELRRGDVCVADRRCGRRRRSIPSRRRAQRRPAHRRSRRSRSARARGRPRAWRRRDVAYTTAMRSTPATSAGTAAMTSDDGSGKRPLGTQIPTEPNANHRRSETIPGAASTTESIGR